MLKRPRWHPGTLVTLEHTSRVLADNPLGDPHVRRVAVWLPPQYDAGRSRGVHGIGARSHGLEEFRREPT
jgi:hypothetical protein